jgi:hypothetical protein
MASGIKTVTCHQLGTGVQELRNLRMWQTTGTASTTEGVMWFDTAATGSGGKRAKYYASSAVQTIPRLDLAESISGLWTFTGTPALNGGSGAPGFSTNCGAPSSAGSTATRVTNLNADYVDGYDTSLTATVSTIALRDSAGCITAADPTASSHLATKSYVDAIAAGLTVHDPCACATTANITLSGEQTIDGVATSASRVLVKNQTAGAENGIYVSAAGAWSRATDADSDAEVNKGMYTYITGGSTNINRGYVQTVSSPTLGTTALVFSVFFQVASYSAGNGLVLSGVTFSLKIGGSSTWSGGNRVLYSDSTSTITETGQNTTASAKYLQQVSSGVPSWAVIAAGDIGSGAALSKVDDTNVTLALSGSPTTCLLAATTITAGWTGTLSIARGGTGASATATAGGVAYGTGTALAWTSAGTSGYFLTSGGTGAPTWTNTPTLTGLLTFSFATSSTVWTSADEAIRLTTTATSSSNTTHKHSPWFNMQAAVWDGAANATRKMQFQTQGISGTSDAWQFLLRSVGSSNVDVLKITNTGVMTLAQKLTWGATTQLDRILLYEDGSANYGFGVQSGQLNIFCDNTGAAAIGQLSDDQTTFTACATMDRSSNVFKLENSTAFRLNYGYTPSSNVDGNLWVLSTGVYARIASATVQLSSGTGNVLSITGTANQITASAATGAVTLSLPVGIDLGNTAPGINTASNLFTRTTSSTNYPFQIASMYNSTNVDYYLLAGAILSGTYASPTLTKGGTHTAGYIRWDDTNTRWTFAVATGTGSPVSATEMVSITSTGLGIGVTPSYALDVSGHARLGNAANAGGILWVGVGNATPMYLEVDFPVTSQSANFRVFRNTNTSGNCVIDIFKGDNTSTLCHRFIAGASPKLGVGVDPSYTLDVLGTVHATGAVTFDSTLACGIINSELYVSATASGINTGTAPTALFELVQHGSTLTYNTMLKLTGKALTALPASTEVPDVNFDFAYTNQFATGALTTQRTMVIRARTYSFVGASTLTSAATLALTGPPKVGTNATITNSYGLWIDNTASTAAYVTGIYCNPKGTNSTTIGGLEALVESNYSGTTNLVFGIQAYVKSASGNTITSAYSFRALSPVANSGAFTTAYGLWINTQKTTGVTTGYGIYQVDANDINYFAGMVNLPSLTVSTVLQLDSSGNVTGSNTLPAGVTINGKTPARVIAGSVGDGSNTTYTITHNFGTYDVGVSVFDNSTKDDVLFDVTRSSTNAVQVTFVTAPTSNQYRVVIFG